MRTHRTGDSHTTPLTCRNPSCTSLPTEYGSQMPIAVSEISAQTPRCPRQAVPHSLPAPWAQADDTATAMPFTGRFGQGTVRLKNGNRRSAEALQLPSKEATDKQRAPNPLPVSQLPASDAIHRPDASARWLAIPVRQRSQTAAGRPETRLRSHRRPAIAPRRNLSSNPVKSARAPCSHRDRRTSDRITEETRTTGSHAPYDAPKPPHAAAHLPDAPAETAARAPSRPRPHRLLTGLPQQPHTRMERGLTTTDARAGTGFRDRFASHSRRFRHAFPRPLGLSMPCRGGSRQRRSPPITHRVKRLSGRCLRRRRSTDHHALERRVNPCRTEGFASTGSTVCSGWRDSVPVHESPQTLPSLMQIRQVPPIEMPMVHNRLPRASRIQRKRSAASIAAPPTATPPQSAATPRRTVSHRGRARLGSGQT